MARRFVRVDLGDGARDFRPVAIEPGVPLLDKPGASAKILFKWLGGMVAEPEWEGDSVSFFVRDDHGGRLEEVFCQPASNEDLQGLLKDDLALLGERLEKAKADSSTERIVLKAVRQQFAAVVQDPQRMDRDCYFFRYRDVHGRWRLVWCPGYQRTDQEPAAPAICTDPDCNLLFVRRPHKSAKCPGCSTTPPMLLAPRKSRKWVFLLALLAFLIGAGLTSYLYNPLTVTPEQWAAPVGGRIEFRVTKPVFFQTRDVSDQARAEADDPRVVRIDPQGLGATAVAPGKTLVHFYVGSRSITSSVTVEPPPNPSRLRMEPAAVDLNVGSTSRLKLFAAFDDGAQRDVTADAEWTSKHDAVATARDGLVEGKAKGKTDIVARYRASPENDWLEATAQVSVADAVAKVEPGKKAPRPEVVEVGKKPPGPEGVQATEAARRGKPSAVVILSDQGDSVRFPVGAQFGDFRVEARYSDGFTRLVTRKATLRSPDPPGQGPVSFAEGQLLGVRPGKTTVQAQFDGVSSTKGLQAEVTAGLDVDEIRLVATPVSLLPGETTLLEAIGYKSGKPVGSITGRGDLAWKSSDEKTVRVDGPAVSGLRPGRASVTAQLGSVASPPAEVRVVPAIAEPLAVEPGLIRLRVGQRCPIGTDLTVSQAGLDVSRLVDVSSSAPDVVRYDPDDHALVGVAPGRSQIAFSRGDKRTAATVEVAAGPLPQGEVVVEPVAAILLPAQAVELRVFLVTKDGLRIDRTGAAALTSSAPDQVQISGQWASALAPGVAEITAALPEASVPGRAYVTVQEDGQPIVRRPAVAPRRFVVRPSDRLWIKPDRAALKVGDSTPRFAVMLQPEGGTPRPVAAAVESLDTRVLAPDGRAAGRFVASAPGRTQVRAFYGGREVYADVTVTGSRFATITTSISNPNDKNFGVSAEVLAPAAEGPLEYRVYAPGQKPPDRWVSAQREGDRLRAVLESPRLPNGPPSAVYRLMFEARDAATKTIQHYPFTFQLKPVIQEKTNPPR